MPHAASPVGGPPREDAAPDDIPAVTPAGTEGHTRATAGDEVTTTVLTAADVDAKEAAARAQVDIVEPTDEVGARLIADAGDRIWGPRGTLARNELRALMHAGDPVHLALDNTQTGRPVVGFAVGFLGWSPLLHLHSHQVGVVDGHRRRGVGYALKLAQRQTCLVHGVTDMRWTFDPLVRRNVAFNLGALGARAASFHVEFYGAMDDVINGGDASDRLEAVWCLTRPLPSRSAPEEASVHAASVHPDSVHPASVHPVGGSAPALILERDGWPELTGADPAPGALLAVPADYETLRRRDRACAGAWRAASREVLRAAYGSGLRIGRVTDSGYELVPQDNV